MGNACALEVSTGWVMRLWPWAERSGTAKTAAASRTDEMRRMVRWKAMAERDFKEETKRRVELQIGIVQLSAF